MGIAFLVGLSISRLLISDEQGASLVCLAREAISAFLADGTTIRPPSGPDVSAGIFVTLNYLTSRNQEHLRGCIGFPVSFKSLHESVVEAAIAAATADPRFPPVDLPELPNLILEVSVLTPPEKLCGSLAQIQESIKIGTHGLILRWKYGSGLLLPQVPVELKWGVEEFLTNTCYKAGAKVEVLHDPSTALFSFQAMVFKELSPGGKVARMHF
jgi:uncharacterized protein (TIGR00296 family)